MSPVVEPQKTAPLAAYSRRILVEAVHAYLVASLRSAFGLGLRARQSRYAVANTAWVVVSTLSRLVGASCGMLYESVATREGHVVCSDCWRHRSRRAMLILRGSVLNRARPI